MVMSIDGFWNGGQKSIALPHGNFLHAATQISFWNLVLTVQMAIPVAAFRESFNHQPVWDRTEKSWIWSYSVPAANGSYVAELHGWINGDAVNWEMYLSKTGGFTNFLWFSGHSQQDNSSGTWYLNHSPDDPEAFLQIDWIKDANGISGIRYLNVVPGAEANGSYIEFGHPATGDYDAFYNLRNEAEDRTIFIRWKSETHEGAVMDPKFFNDPGWHCWDIDFMNTNCS
jgi:hypothetical protein